MIKIVKWEAQKTIIWNGRERLQTVSRMMPEDWDGITEEPKNNESYCGFTDALGNFIPCDKPLECCEKCPKAELERQRVKDNNLKLRWKIDQEWLRNQNKYFS